MSKLKVIKANIEDTRRDIIRIHKSHRGGVANGTLCRVSAVQEDGSKRSVYAFVHGRETNDHTIKIDSFLRQELGVKKGAEYNFIKPQKTPHSVW